MLEEPAIRGKILAAKEALAQELLWERWRAAQLDVRAFKFVGPETIGNIVGIGIGEKVTGGKPTGEICLRVYVVRKVPRDQHPKELLIPPDYDGFATDVIAIGRPTLRQNTMYMRPAPGGISVGNRVENSAGAQR